MVSREEQKVSRRKVVRTISAVGIGAGSGCGIGPTDDATTVDAPGTHFVSVMEGSPNGDGTRDAPYASIQETLHRAEPGDTIHVLPGEYREVLNVPHGGTVGSPITLTGPPDAVVRPPRDVEQGRPILEVMRSHFHVTGLTFDGLAKPDRPNDRHSYSGGVELKADPEIHDYMTDLKMMPYGLGNFEGAMIATERIENVEIGGFQIIGPAGVQYLYTDESAAFAEIVYLGSGINVNAEDYHWDTIDETRDIHVHHIDNSAGYPHSELVDAKPGTRDITIEYCTDHGGSGYFIDSPAIGAKGKTITIRWNDLRNGEGDGIQIAAWNVTHPDEYSGTIPDAVKDSGRNNSIYDNRITGFGHLALKFQPNQDETDPGFVEGYGPDAQNIICGNTYTGETHGSPDKACPESVPTGDGNGHTGGRTPDEHG